MFDKFDLAWFKLSKGGRMKKTFFAWLATIGVVFWAYWAYFGYNEQMPKPDWSGAIFITAMALVMTWIVYHEWRSQMFVFLLGSWCCGLLLAGAEKVSNLSDPTMILTNPVMIGLSFAVGIAMALWVLVRYDQEGRVFQIVTVLYFMGVWTALSMMYQPIPSFMGTFLPTLMLPVAYVFNITIGKLVINALVKLGRTMFPPQKQS
jgi:uncharacterized membrane protein YoaK (UPF0700 family)